MAMLWQVLREEFKNTVDDFRTKGAVGTFKDAALDACDMVADAGSVVYNGAKTIVAPGDESGVAVVRSTDLPCVGEQAQMEVGVGQSVCVEVLAVDTIATPPRVRVKREDNKQCLVVPVLAPGVPLPESESESQEFVGAGLLNGLKNEWQCTVEDFKTKGAAGALKDAALDAVDLLGTATTTAIGATKSVAGKTLDLLTGDEEEVTPPAQAVQAQQPVAAPTTSAAPSVPAPTSQPASLSPDDTAAGCIRQRQMKVPATTPNSERKEEEELID